MISPSLPRYLVAIAAIAAVLLGAAFVYFASRRAGLTAARAAGRATATDEQSRLSASIGVLAQQIVDLDTKPRSAAAETRYRRLASDYAALIDDPALDLKRVTALQARARRLG